MDYDTPSDTPIDSASAEDLASDGQERALAVVPKELRIERRLSNVARGAALTWLPVALLAPIAFMVEAVPAAIGILMVIGLTIRELRRGSSDVLPELELADGGNLEEASIHVAEMASRERNWRRKAFLIGILANIELRAGNHANAEVLARESIRHPLSDHPVLERSLRAGLAVIVMLRGEKEEAFKLLSTTPLPDPATDSSRLLVWALAGMWTEVAEYKHMRLPPMPGLKHHNRVIAVCKAMALETIGTGALKRQRFLDEARPRLANEFDYLSSQWPELAKFIESHPELHAPRAILMRSF